MTVVREARLAAGLTQAEVAVRAGIARSNLAAIEAGSRVASEQMIQRILAATGYHTASELLAARREEIIATIEEHGGSNPRVFGSVARKEDGPASDIDLLVTVQPGRFWAFTALPRVLSELLGRRVDVLADGNLSPRFQHVYGEAVAL
ncbi:MAG: helix-turn-helix domain-containing protein [Cellulomonadaceae bacterium]|jgi:predicted nucleotidyltransferase/DNA-binding XRE family transcriptional regulator|nr:helix-turn-helix domain-containing protein [Cellulomonadaceae bacterium]